MQHSANDIDAMILEEKRISATECHDEAWAAGLLAGIEPEIIAETAVVIALEELHRDSGEEAVLALLERMREQALNGSFDPNLSRH
ncbi:hypothetical protein CSC94_06415 [Zhengella mangrovi]|uniref:Uncharacterized protein n=1 Tax=Zhengella mangrovi TaxID=1982044 RepID=A0A2G1QS21_9HYPH|nr:hypothetical protein [Zhengella mangrovi]PHP68279.1 hypothetical protein CSC94_06415 [Zhengella mangrovi]